MPRRPLGLAAAAAAAAVTLAGCSGSPITAARLNAAIGPTFTHLYAAQQKLIGNPVDPAAYTTASCSRGGNVLAGAGDDWVCVVTVYRRTGLPIGASIEVKVRTNGCFVADPPFSVVGPVTVTTPDGAEAANPLAEFDGCFDTT